MRQVSFWINKSFYELSNLSENEMLCCQKVIDGSEKIWQFSGKKNLVKKGREIQIHKINGKLDMHT